MKPNILILEHDKNIREAVRFALGHDYELTFTENSKKVIQFIKNQSFDICLVDTELPDGSGLELLGRIQDHDRFLGVIMVVSMLGIEDALKGMNLGVIDYIKKPFKTVELQERINHVLIRRSLEKQNQILWEEMISNIQLPLLGKSRAIQEVNRKIKHFSKLESPVLINGEIGTGHEETAQEIQTKGLRRRFPFVSFTCGSLTKNQIEKAIFGEEGLESKKRSQHIGKLEIAKNGIFYIQQVDRLPLDIQEKLFRAFTSRKISRVGGHTPIALDARIIASTNSDLMVEMEKGRFRKDLFQFLNQHSIDLPPLRNRSEDITYLIDYLVKLNNPKAKIHVKHIQREAIQFLTQYEWPGNIKELEISIEMMVLFAEKEVLDIEDLPIHILIKQIDLAKTKEESKLSLRRVRRHIERHFIRKVLERNRGNQSQTASKLGLHRNTLIWKIKELDLENDYERIVKKRRDHGLGFREM